MAPVFYRLDADVEEVQGVPTDLNARLLSGELDVAPISSIEYARHADHLRLLPRRCAQVGVRGPDTALRSRPAVARAHGAADGVRGVGVPGAGACRPGRARGR